MAALYEAFYSWAVATISYGSRRLRLSRYVQSSVGVQLPWDAGSFHAVSQSDVV